MASASPEKTGDIPSATSGGQTALQDNTIVVVAGASGDLARKKTFPALFGLYANGFLPKGRIVGYARTKMSPDEFHDRVKEHIKAPIPELKKKLTEFLELCTYVSGQYDKDDGFQDLEKEMNKHEEKYSDKNAPRNRVFYMALPPSVFTTVAEHFKRNNYSSNGINRIIVEKPFGHDLESSRELDQHLKEHWKEEEIFRIDHYLGKEMVKNLLVLRFANVMMEASLNRNLISNVQITFKEPFGVEGRAGYFSDIGIIRDVMQNHLLQVLSILTMERPVSFEAEDIRNEKVKALRFIPPIQEQDVLLGQYTAGETQDGKKPGYLDDETVDKDSNCPTFAAIVLHVNNPRWEGVPFILRAGKALNEAKVEIRIQYKSAVQGIFDDLARNELVIRVQPSESVYLKVNTKAPGLAMRTVPTELDLTYRKRFSDLKIPEAYEALILDAFKGDHSNFVRDDELDIAWRIFTPILHWIDKSKPKPEPYAYGTRGPASLDSFVKQHAGYERADHYQWPATSVL